MRKVIGMFVVGSALLGGCARYGVQVYPVTAKQLTAMREVAGILPCPAGKTDIAGVVEFPDGGGEITVKCGIVK